MKRAILTALIILTSAAYAADHILAYRPGYAVTQTPWPSIQTNALPETTWLTGYMANSTNLLDYSAAKSDVPLVGAPCGTFTGVGYLAIAGLTTNTTVVSSQGTATPTVAAGRVDFTAGTCWDLNLSNGSRYIFSERSGTTVYDVSGNGGHGTLTSVPSLTVFWAGSQNSLFWNHANGHSKVLSFNGADASASFSPIILSKTNTWSIEGLLTRINTAAEGHILANTTTNGGGIARVYYNISGTQINVNYSDIPPSTQFPNAIHSNGYFKVTHNATTGKFEWTDRNGVSTNVPYENYDIYLNSIASKRNAGTVVPIGNFDVGYIKITTPSGSLYYSSSTSYGNTLPDSTGTNDATLVNTAFKYIPALASGTNDTAGLGLTNPKGYVHNNGEYSLVIGGVTNSYANLLTNTAYNATIATNRMISEVWK